MCMKFMYILYTKIFMSKKLKKLKLKHRNYLVAIVMRKAVQKHKDKKRELKNKGYNDEKV